MLIDVHILEACVGRHTCSRLWAYFERVVRCRMPTCKQGARFASIHRGSAADPLRSTKLSATGMDSAC